jgi:hypothetical protein
MANFGPMANMQTNEESRLDIFKKSTRTIEPTKEVMNKEWFMFRKFQVHAKDIKCLLEWGTKHKFLFPIVAFLVHHILGIVCSQIKIIFFFSLARIFTNLRRCHLQSNNFNKIIFVSKN